MNPLALLRRRKPVSLLPAQEAYALWAVSYPPHPHNSLMELEQAAMQALIPPLAGKTVLDLACGTGRYGLLAQEDARVIGVDNSLPMLRAGREAGVRYPLVDSSMVALPFGSAAFDVILCGLATGHLKPDLLASAFNEMARVLKPGGVALFSDFHPALYARGGRRVFTGQNGQQYEVEHYPHSVRDYTQAIRAAGLKITTVEEPCADYNGMSVMAILVMRCEKPGASGEAAPG